MPLVYLDQNILSWADDTNFIDLIQRMKGMGLMPVISFVHMTEICRSPKFELFIERLDKIQPFFLSDEAHKALIDNGSVELRPISSRETISFHRHNMAKFEVEYFGILVPLLKVCGGLRGTSQEEIEDTYLESFRRAMDAIFEDCQPSEGGLTSIEIALKNQLTNDAERHIRANFKQIDFSSDQTRMSDMRRRVSALVDANQIDASELLKCVFDCLDESERLDLIATYPPGFGKDLKKRFDAILAFSMILFSIGAISGTGRVFRGSADSQLQRFKAQFLDSMHLGLASHFDAFLTNDAGAFRLGAVIFPHAGVATISLPIERLTDM